MVLMTIQSYNGAQKNNNTQLMTAFCTAVAKSSWALRICLIFMKVAVSRGYTISFCDFPISKVKVHIMPDSQPQRFAFSNCDKKYHEIESKSLNNRSGNSGPKHSGNSGTVCTSVIFFSPYAISFSPRKLRRGIRNSQGRCGLLHPSI